MSKKQQRTAKTTQPKTQPPYQMALAFDAERARQARDVGADLALMADDALPWAMRAERWLLRHAVAEPFTSEQLVADIGLPRESVGANRNNAVGALFLKWSKRGAIHKIGYRPSKRPSSHAALLAVWTRDGAQPAQVVAAQVA